MQNLDKIATDTVLLAEARGWLADNDWQEFGAEGIAELLPYAVARSIDRFYVGGAPAFIAACR